MPVLAEYTIRSKQSYIFKTNRITEIAGASALIRDAFFLLFEVAREEGIKAEPVSDKSPDFLLKKTLDAFKNGSLQMVELFAGGGNDTVLFDSETTFQRVNRAYTRKLLDVCPGMIPMCVGISVGDDGYHYQHDYNRLMLACEAEKNQMSPCVSMEPLPFALRDRAVDQAVVSRETIGAKSEWTAEGLSKLKKYASEPTPVRALDELATERGVESMLAMVHADGNNMGQKIIHMLESHPDDYDHCVTLLRKMTKNVADSFSKCGKQAVEDKAAQLKAAKYANLPEKAFSVRWIVTEGDDISFICNARIAKELTCAYLEAVAKASPLPEMGQKYSSCAGICLFHSHFPCSSAYALAEDACTLAKKHVHETGEDEAWIDFHYLHSGFGSDLTELRKWQNTLRCMARPWCVDGESTLFSIANLDTLAQLFKDFKVSRSSIKSLGVAWEIGAEAGIQELQRVYYRAPGLKNKLQDLFENDETALKAIYDLQEVYDVWYGGRDVT